MSPREKPTAPGAPERLTTPGSRGTVLVVDDDVDILVMTSFALETAGYQVRSATDVAQALEAAAVLRPDVVLLDHRLPLQPGLAAVEQLRRDPAVAGAALVLVSGLRFSPEQVAHLDGYLRKPWNPEELFALVDRLVDRRRPPTGNA